jgi:NitT/TauT family transport system ATP-binding protein
VTGLALDVGFVPLVDAAPLIMAREIGFAAEEGLSLHLHRAPSWAALRDRLVWGAHHAAHMLAPMPIALSAGIGARPVRVDVLSVLSVNGDMIGVRPELARRIGTVNLDPLDAAGAGRALAAAGEDRLRIGVPFPFSMHAELLNYWMASIPMPGGVEIRTVPPPDMVAALLSGEIDAFCVGEPWGSLAVERGAAELILSTSAIWQFAPEKVLAVRHDWAETNRETAFRLMRAVWRAARWLSEPSNRITASEILAREAYLDLPAEIIERSLRGRIVLNARGVEHSIPRCPEFFAGAATFPWRSQALWIADSLARRTGHDSGVLRAAARSCFRSDLYRAALGPIGADLPGASEKLEGALPHRTEVSSTLGKLVLGPDRFFDGRVFDPLTIS